MSGGNGSRGVGAPATSRQRSPRVSVASGSIAVGDEGRTSEEMPSPRLSPGKRQSAEHDGLGPLEMVRRRLHVEEGKGATVEGLGRPPGAGSNVELIHRSEPLMGYVVSVDDVGIEVVAAAGLGSLAGLTFSPFDAGLDFAQESQPRPIVRGQRIASVGHGPRDAFPRPIVVRDAKRPAHADCGPILREDVGADGVKRPRPDVAARQPVFELLRGPVGKRHGKQLAGVHAIREQSAGSRRERVRLAAAWPGKNQEVTGVAIECDNGCLLVGEPLLLLHTTLRRHSRGVDDLDIRAGDDATILLRSKSIARKSVWPKSEVHIRPS